MKTSTIKVRDTLSVLSVLGVEKRIGEVPGVESVTVNYAAGRATVRYEETRLNIADIKSHVRQSGYESTAPTATSASDGQQCKAALIAQPSTPAAAEAKAPAAAPAAVPAPATPPQPRAKRVTQHRALSLQRRCLLCRRVQRPPPQLPPSRKRHPQSNQRLHPQPSRKQRQPSRSSRRRQPQPRRSWTRL